MDNSNNLNVFKYGYLNCNPRNWWHNLKQFFCNIKYAYQRATKGFCAQDVWDIDTFHTDLMIEMLTAFKKDNNGYPAIFSNEPNGEQKWNNIIDEIILHFTNYRNADTSYNEFKNKYFTLLDKYTECGINEQGMHYQKVHNENFTDEERKLQENYHQKVKDIESYKQQELEAGMKLFTKWYQNLWW